MTPPEWRFGALQTVLPRLGQGSFRVLITDVYKRTCAMSGSHVLHVLDVAHIMPYAKGGKHTLTNGVLLRQDLYTLLDLGYLTVPESASTRSSVPISLRGRALRHWHLFRALVRSSSRPLTSENSRSLPWCSASVAVALPAG